MSAAEAAVESAGSEGAAPVESGGEVGGSPSPQSEATSPGAAPSRPEYLLEGYDSETAQAQAFHKFHQQYGGNHDFYAQQGAYISDRYHNDPAFREWFDNYRQGKQPQAVQPQKQEPPPYDKSNPETLDKFWNEAIADPDRLFQLAEDRAFQRIQRELGPQLAELKQAQNTERAHRLFATHQATLQEMQGNPYGQKLLALTNRGMTPEEAIATYQAAKQQFAAQQAAATTQTPKASEPVRDATGRFQSPAGNGRRAGMAQSGKALTPDEIISEAKAGRFR